MKLGSSVQIEMFLSGNTPCPCVFAQRMISVQKVIVELLINDTCRDQQTENVMFINLYSNVFIQQYYIVMYNIRNCTMEVNITKRHGKELRIKKSNQTGQQELKR